MHRTPTPCLRSVIVAGLAAGLTAFVCASAASAAPARPESHGVGWRAELSLGLPDIVSTYQALEFGPGLAVGPIVGGTLTARSPAEVAPLVGGAIEARVRDWQVVALHVRASGAALFASGATGSRGTLGAQLARAEDQGHTRFGLQLALDVVGDRVTVVPGVVFARSWGRVR